jgi:prepilin-type N-terminal cleavage/methylation domain-containing protein
MIRSRRTDKGFTLIEVAISIAILGVALTTLISLQSGYLRNSLNDKNLVRAALMAQYILAVVEGDDNFPEPGKSEKDLIPILDRIGYFEENEQLALQKRDFEGWLLRREITNVGIPPMESALRRIVLEIMWGDTQSESFSVTYFIKSPDLPIGSTEGDDDAEGAGGTEDAAGEEVGGDG